MWEMRGEPRHHVSSKLSCWVALDRAIDLAPRLGMFARVPDATGERDAVRDAILTQGWSEARGAVTQSFRSNDLDAAQLLMPLLGFLSADDARMRATIDAIAEDLTQDDLVVRYRSQSGLNDDGLRGEEGTFVICTFWVVSALAKAGEVDRAQELFDRVVGYANDLLLLSRTGELMGNFPHAFSHVGLITAAWEIDKARAQQSRSTA